MLDVLRWLIVECRIFRVCILVGWRVIRGLDAPEVALSALKIPNCCQVSGFEDKISAFLRTEDSDPNYEDGVESVINCLRGLAVTNREKGNDRNYEAEGELRSSTAISVKHPFRTVLACKYRPYGLRLYLSGHLTLLPQIFYAIGDTYLNVKSTMKREHAMNATHETIRLLVV